MEGGAAQIDAHTALALTVANGVHGLVALIDYL